MAENETVIRTPTQSELATFKVMANLDFVDLKKPPPSSVPQYVEETKEEPTKDLEEPIRVPEVPKQVEIVVTEEKQYEELETPEMNGRHEMNERPERLERPPMIHEQYEEPKYEEPNKEYEQFLYTKAKKISQAEIQAEKEGLLLELQLMEKQGLIKLPREFSMDDSLEELQFQVDRANSNYSAIQAVDLAKTGIRVGSTAIEMLLRKLGINLLDGFSNHLCKDMNKFTRPLTRIYRKYWRRGGLTNPETELLMMVVGSMAMTAIQNKNLGSLTGVSNLVSGMMPNATSNVNTNAAKLKPPVLPSWNSATPVVNTEATKSWSSPPVVVPDQAFENTKAVTIGTPNSTVKTKSKKSSNESVLNL